MFTAMIGDHVGASKIQVARDRVAQAEEVAETAKDRLSEAKDAYLKVALAEVEPTVTGFGTDQ